MTPCQVIVNFTSDLNLMYTASMTYDSLLVLGIDLEGINQDIDSGVDLKTDRVIEIGAVLWDCNHKQPVKMISELVEESDRLPLSNEVIQLTGIREEMLKTFGLRDDSLKKCLSDLCELVQQADYLMAHNSEGYDRPMLEGLFARNNMKLPDKIWIDTMTDIEYPSKIHGRSMALLEHAHGFINPFPHRAVTDVLSMLKIASQYSMSRMGALAKSPKVKLIAKLDPPKNWKDPKAVEIFNKEKTKVSKAKFRWDPNKKTWSKKVHKLLLDEGKIQYEFDTYQSE